MGSETVGRAAERALRWRLGWRSWSSWLAVALPVVVGFWVVALVLATGPSLPKVVLAAGAVGLCAHMAVTLTRQNLAHQVALDSLSLTIRRRSGTTQVPLTDLTGVVVTKTGQWACWVIPTTGEAVELGAPAAVFTTHRQSNAAMTEDYWRKVAESPSGRQATAVYDAALRAQGGTGPLSQGRALAELLGSEEALRGVRRWSSPTGERTPST